MSSTHGPRLRTGEAIGRNMMPVKRKVAYRPPALIFDAGPISDVQPDLVRIAGGEQAGC